MAKSKQTPVLHKDCHCCCPIREESFALNLIKCRMPWMKWPVRTAWKLLHGDAAGCQTMNTSERESNYSVFLIKKWINLWRGLVRFNVPPRTYRGRVFTDQICKTNGIYSRIGQHQCILNNWRHVPRKLLMTLAPTNMQRRSTHRQRTYCICTGGSLAVEQHSQLILKLNIQHRYRFQNSATLCAQNFVQNWPL